MSLPDFKDVITTFLYLHVYSSINFCTLGPNDPMLSCKPPKTLGGSFPDKVIAYCAVYERVCHLFISFLLTSTTLDGKSSTISGLLLAGNNSSQIILAYS